MKVVQIVAYHFDALPGHVQITSRGVGSNLRTAVGDGVRNVLKHKSLKGKHVHEFKLTVVVLANHKEG